MKTYVTGKTKFAVVLLCPSISLKQIKLESCSWAQKKRLEIFFPEREILGFECGKIYDQKCGFFIEARGTIYCMNLLPLDLLYTVHSPAALPLRWLQAENTCRALYTIMVT